MDSFRCIKPCVESEFGKLEYVMLHAPGNEIENMTPENAHKFLFSDILNKNEAMADYKDFFGTLSKVSNVVVFDQLLEETLQNDKVKQQVVEKICTNENVKYLIPILSEMSAAELAKVLVEGFQSKGLKERFVLDPIPNLFFMRDASFTMFGDIIINKMATDVRDRETILLDAIFRNTKLFNTEVVHPVERYTPRPGGSIEGGDVHIARHDIVLSGMGLRTNRIGIDALINHLKSKKHRETPYLPRTSVGTRVVHTFGHGVYTARPKQVYGVQTSHNEQQVQDDAFGYQWRKSSQNHRGRKPCVSPQQSRDGTRTHLLRRRRRLCGGPRTMAQRSQLLQFRPRKDSRLRTQQSHHRSVI